MRQPKKSFGCCGLEGVSSRHTIDKSVSYWLGLDIDEMQQESKSSLRMVNAGHVGLVWFCLEYVLASLRRHKMKNCQEHQDWMKDGDGLLFSTKNNSSCTTA